MNSKAMSLKAKIRNFAKSKNISAQVVLHNYMFERFLERVSKSQYKNKFILKGGLLVSSIIGLDVRTTKDLDATIQSYPINTENVQKIVDDICSIDIDDEITFQTLGVSNIRKDDEYGGFRVSLEAYYETIKAPLSIDITVGDVITPKAIQHQLHSIFDETKIIKILAYNIETVLAEKVETILRRGIFNTRPRDFYDVYILAKTQPYNIEVFKKALKATSEHRQTANQISNVDQILSTIEKSNELKSHWTKYQQEFFYAEDIKYLDVIKELKKLLQK